VVAASLSLVATVGLSAAPSANAVPGAGVAAADRGFSTTDRAPGWASVEGGTKGGAGADAASTYLVADRAQLLVAFANHGEPDAPKIIYVKGTIFGNEASDGRLLGEQDLAPGYDIDKYLSCYGEDGVWSDSRFDYCGDQRRWRTTGSSKLKQQIELNVPSNTTIVGLGADAGFKQANLIFHVVDNVVVRNLTVEAPVDYFTSWDPWDGLTGAWNARFDAMSAITATHIWVDHVTLTDGDHLDVDAGASPNGAPINRHDGLFDMKDGTDFVTLSNSLLENHDKTMLLGSGDDNADTDEGHLKISIIGNHFKGIQERAPRVRYGDVHVLNNYFEAKVNDPRSPVVSTGAGGAHYFLGLGYQSQVLSERNAFDYTGPGADASVAVYVWNANRFEDVGSWFGGKPVDLGEIASEQYDALVRDLEASGEPLPDWASTGFAAGVDWAPPYGYRPLSTASAVKQHAKHETGAGVLDVRQG